jgi:hypothetical protein
MQDAFFKPSSRGATQVPRPKSELTKNGQNYRGAFNPKRSTQSTKKLGKSKWLRQLLLQSIKEKKSV